MICMDPEKLAKFYCEVFEMKEVTRAPATAAPTSSSPTAT